MRAIDDFRNPRERHVDGSHLCAQLLGIAASATARAVLASEVGWPVEKG